MTISFYRGTICVLLATLLVSACAGVRRGWSPEPDPFAAPGRLPDPVRVHLFERGEVVLRSAYIEADSLVGYRSDERLAYGFTEVERVERFEEGAMTEVTAFAILVVGAALIAGWITLPGD